MTPILQAENIYKSYGSLSILSDISLFINKDDKVALVARNGAGKTTLLNILSGTDTPDSGEIITRKDLKTGYLRQEPVLDEDMTVIEQVFESNNEISSAIRNYEKALKNGDKSLLDKAISQMDALQAWNRETEARQILTELNLADFDKPVRLLSGGQRKRVALAKVLIDKPELLILDEPTNHLDLDMTEWLENFLKKTAITLLIVTHDRYFLDRVCNQIIELDNNNIYKYSGNYSYYVLKRTERLENIQSVTDKAQNLLRKEIEWMRRMPKARTTKSKTRIDAFYELKERASKKSETENITIKSASRRLGNKILELKNINKSFDGKTIIEDFSYSFSRFEKIGIIGKNGTGKSTFLNILTGKLKSDSGFIDLGETVKFGYFRQEGINFDEKKRVIDAVREIAEVVKMADGSTISTSQILTQFLFPPARQHDFISKLSGGEKRRLYLVTVLMGNPNFLILDEPTNDLDIDTLNVLEDYLSVAGICLLVVSHDRFFLDKISDHIFIFEGSGQIRDFPGNYTQYRIRLKEEEEAQNRAEKSVAAKTTSARNSSNNADRKKESESKKRLSFNEKFEFEKLEADIEELENEKKSLEEALSSGTLNSVELQEYSEKHARISDQLNLKSDRWLELSEKL